MRGRGRPRAGIRSRAPGAAILAFAALIPFPRADALADGGAATPSPASAAAPQAGLERVEVRDTAEGPAALDPTAFATVIRAEDFAGRVASLDELLRQTVGVQVRSLGGPFATVSIRGSTAEQVVVYLDGVPLNRALGGAVNLADLPLGQVDSIEIYRGFTPASLPAASIGGAVLIHTRQAEGRSGGGASAAYGSYGTGEAVASLSASRPRSDLFLGLDASTARGDFRFADDNGTTFTTADDAAARRANNDFTQGNLTGRWSLRLGERARVRLSADALSRHQGVPGIDANQSKTARLAAARGLLRSEIEAPGLLDGRLLLRGALDYTHYTEAFDDRLGDLGAARRSEDRTSSFAQEIGAVVVAGRRQAVSLMASHRRETAGLRDRMLAEPDIGRASRDTAVVTLEDQISLASGRLTLNPSLRHERYDGSFRPGPADMLLPDSLTASDGHTTGKVGFRLRAGEAFTLKGNAGRFVRLPDFTELFGDRGSVRGNPALVPERGRSIDLGIVVSRRAGPLLRQAGLEATVFETLADDLILFVRNSQGTVVARNFGRARVAGIELSLSLALGARFTGSLNATHQRAVDVSGDRSNGLLLPGRPEDEISAGAGWRTARGQISYEFTYVGRNFTESFETASLALPARYLHDVAYRLRLAHGLQATLEIKNLFDRRTYDVAQFPLPGRSVNGRVAWEF
ncbi:MAG: hypothetical protein DMF50_05130 [Acidobacteria bacterium]|nr:MAG: hypothetical protein DMF50_05130 [Acidobacteriota bacterium]